MPSTDLCWAIVRPWSTYRLAIISPPSRFGLPVIASVSIQTSLDAPSSRSRSTFSYNRNSSRTGFAGASQFHLDDTTPPQLDVYLTLLTSACEKTGLARTG